MDASFQRFAAAIAQPSPGPKVSATDTNGRTLLLYALVKRAAYTTDAGRQTFDIAMSSIAFGAALLVIGGYVGAFDADDFGLLKSGAELPLFDSATLERVVLRDVGGPRDGQLSLEEIAAGVAAEDARERQQLVAARIGECRLESQLGDAAPRDSVPLMSFVSVSAHAKEWAAVEVERLYAALFACPGGKAVAVFTDYVGHDRLPLLAVRHFPTESWAQHEGDIRRLLSAKPPRGR